MKQETSTQHVTERKKEGALSRDQDYPCWLRMLIYISFTSRHRTSPFLNLISEVLMYLHWTYSFENNRCNRRMWPGALELEMCSTSSFQIRFCSRNFHFMCPLSPALHSHPSQLQFSKTGRSQSAPRALVRRRALSFSPIWRATCGVHARVETRIATISA